MNRLIEALTIFAKYKDLGRPTHCEHDVLYIVGVTMEEVLEEDWGRLEELGFDWDSQNGWHSFRYGSA